MESGKGFGGSEIVRGWRVLLGSTIGVGLGISGLLTYNLGLFTTELASEIGLSPASYGAALLGLNVALAAAMPFVAYSVDRFGPRNTAATGAVLLALGFFALSRVSSIAAYAGVLILMGLCASFSSPVAPTRAVAGSFNNQRGLALGITQVGIGLAAAIVPPVVAAQIGRAGWQSGFVLLAALALAGTVPILMGMPRKLTPEASGTDQHQPSSKPWRSGLFWLQLMAFGTMAFAFVGIIAHFVPMLRAAGVSLAAAGALAGSIGLSVIVTRLVVGWLADRMDPAWLGAASCVVCAVGAATLAFGGTAFALPAALALGCAIGAEADLIGILTARNFPLSSYSRAYSLQYAAFTLAAGASPLVVGLLQEASGSYRLPLASGAGVLILATVLFGVLARTPQPAGSSASHTPAINS